MSLHLKSIYFGVLLLSFGYQLALCSSLPTFRIIAPQTICKHPANGSLVADPQVIVVGFQPRDGIKLTYKVRIFFKSVGNRTRSQRNTLLVWKAVRSLENRINVKERLNISQQNMVSINKTEVQPGVVYMFHVIGVTDAGEASAEQIFTVKYTDGVLGRNETLVDLNLLLLGAESTVASIPYLITAKVTFCNPRYDFYLRWRMLDLDEEFQDMMHTTGSVLKIPPNTLSAGKEYQITAAVMQADDLELARDVITIQVMKRGFQAYIIPTSIKIGPNKPTLFEVFVQDFDNNCNNLDILWKCTAIDGGRCTPVERVNSTKAEFTFILPGSYDISITLKDESITKSIRAEVTVDSTIYVNYEFSNIPNLIPSAGQGLTFSVLIMDLIPRCKAGWSSAQEDGFAYIGAEEIGEGFATIEVKDLEREYLSEIADYGNSTVNREITLNVPVASDQWSGLKGDTNYKFRLDTVCPGMYVQGEAEGVNRAIVSSFEFVVHTNSPPIPGELQVKPSQGIALQTMFEVSSQSAKDLLLDTPLSYEFLIQLEDYVISLGKLYEFKSIETQLPYTGFPVQVACRVCDIRGACSLKSGPKVNVAPAEYTEEEVEAMEDRIKDAFQRADFNDGQNLLLMTTLTYKNSPNGEGTFNAFKSFATNLLIKQIEKQYESPTEKYYISKEDIVSFISKTKVNLDLLHVTDPSILEKLLDLLDLIAEEDSETNSANIESFRRRKRDEKDDAVLLPLEGRSIVDEEYIRTSLSLIENILRSYNDENMQQEKAKIIQKIPMLAIKMCASDLITKESIYTSVAAIDIEKMTGNHLIEKNFTIASYYRPPLGHYQITMPGLKSRVKYYCMAFIQFPEDYFDGVKQSTYKLLVIDLDTLSPLKELESDGRNFVVGLNIPKFGDTDVACLMRSPDQWSSNLCSTKVLTRTHVTCDCKSFGFYKVGVTTRSEQMIPSLTPLNKKPSTIVRPPSNRPIVATPNQTDTSTTPKATLKPVRPTKSVSLADATAPTTTNTKDSKLIQTEKRTSTASSLGFVLPLIALFLILLVIVGVVFYRRRKRNILSNNLQNLDIMGTLPRESRPGIKYAKFYDEHLMTGSFSNTLVS